jgi:hypothetical protein
MKLGICTSVDQLPADNGDEFLVKLSRFSRAGQVTPYSMALGEGENFRQ